MKVVITSSFYFIISFIYIKARFELQGHLPNLSINLFPAGMDTSQMNLWDVL